MICIIKRDAETEISGWIIATDVHDARRQAEATGEHELARSLYTGYDFPEPGKYELVELSAALGSPIYTMLVTDN
ncbi:MAG: hypothetical protein JAY60_19595 [Candidatus Thiodiazotropha weberae]|nr:hypothetical protein [Candidatus Thiodiazotropha weberae]